ncbi:MAG: glycosyltransferase [Bryobacteraceae bacterium]|nr:glycosyltransferase [Bryobacteraceae bacterium]
MAARDRTVAISAVVISRNEGALLRDTVENLRATLPETAEIVVVDDASSDGSTDFLSQGQEVRLLRNDSATGVARARNQGARASTGEVLVFCDAHMSFDAGWWQPVCELLERPRAGAASPAMAEMPARQHVGYGLSLPKPHLEASWLKEAPQGPVLVPVLPGACMAIRRGIFDAVGGFDEGMLAAGNVDNEMCLRLWTLGYQQWVTPETIAGHHFREGVPYPLPPRISLHNRLRLALVHFSPARLDIVVGTLRQYREFGEALLMVVDSDVAARRQLVQAARRETDDWFFRSFGLEW